MTAEVLSQLKVLRGGLAETVQGDPRYLTLSALDRSVAEIGAVAGGSPGQGGAIPNQVLGQLKTIRDGIADGLRNDHRYLTLTTLDKSIAEIGGMLAASGLIAPEHAAPMAPVHLEPVAPAANGAAAPAAAAPFAASAAAPAPAPAPAAPERKKAEPKPLVETAAVVAAGGLAVEGIASELKKSPLAKDKPKPAAAPEEQEDEKPEADEAEAGDEATGDKAEGDEAAGNEAEGDEAGADEAAGDEAEADEPDAGEAAGDKAEADDGAPDMAEAGEAAGDEAEADEPAGDAAEDETAQDHRAAGDEAAGDEVDADEAAHHGDESKEDGTTAPEAGEGDHEEKHESEGEGTNAEAGNAASDTASIVPPGKASGYVPMAAKPGAAQYQPGFSVKFGKLPNKVDLRPLMTPIEDQGNTSSCVANAVAGAYEYWIKKASKQETNISRLFVYYNARWRDGSQDKDDGSVIQLAMEGLSKFGACQEHVWPFDPRLVLKKPGGEAYKDAAPYRVQDMAQMPLRLDAWKQALAEGKPVVFGCALFDSFDECVKRGGVVPMPSPDDVARAKHSGHSMCAVGYSDSEKVFIVRNSWGADWADKGYCYMPYDYLMNPKFNDGDCWVFVPKVPMQPPREVWSDTTEPVTNGGQGVDFPISAYSIADYEHVAVDLFEHVRKPFNTTILEDYGQYVSLASRSLWSEFETFDFATFLTSTAALTGVTSLATEFLSEMSETDTSETSESSEETEETEEGSEETDAADSDTDEDAEDDSSDDSGDGSDDDQSDDDETDDAADEESEDGDAEGDDDADSDDAESDDAADTDEADGDDAAGEDGADSDEDSEDDESDQDDDSGDDDAESDDESGGDDSEDEGEGGGDDEGDDD